MDTWMDPFDGTQSRSILLKWLGFETKPVTNLYLKLNMLVFDKSM